MLSDGTFDRTVSLAKALPSKPGGLNTGRLAVLADYAGKSRIIAIADYFSQAVLKVVHDHLFSVLKLTVGDSTFDQNHSIEVIQQWHKEGRKTWSYDLSSATDRFPLHLIRVTMQNVMFSNEQGFNPNRFTYYFCKVLSERTFKVPRVKTTVRWKVGQPLGLYSSWAAFTLAHHAVVRLCELRAGRSPGRNYVILGDDIVIADEATAFQYRSLMESIGVKISLPKSLTPTAVTPYQAEFCKRIIVKGEEYSSLPLRLLKARHLGYALTTFFNSVTLKSS